MLLQSSAAHTEKCLIQTQSSWSFWLCRPFFLFLLPFWSSELSFRISCLNSQFYNQVYSRLVNSILRPFLLAFRDRSNSSALGLAFGVWTRTTEFICLHFLSCLHRQNCFSAANVGCSGRVFDWDYLFTFSRSWSWKRQQQNVEIRYSTNNDKITCIRCEIMNLPLKILTCDSMLENTDGLGSRHSNYCKNSDAKYLVGLGKKLIPIHQITKEILSKCFL